MENSSITRDNLPKSMRYASSSVNAVEADCQISRFDSVNGSSGFTATGSNIIRIRVKADGFLDTQRHLLEFTVAITGHEAQIDGSAQSFFDQMTISANGVILEQIDRYGLYSGIKRNWTSEYKDIQRHSAEAGGAVLASQTQLGAFGLAAADTAAAVKAASDAFLLASNGLVCDVALGNLGQILQVDESKVFTIQLNSGLLLNQHMKALPDGVQEIEIALRLKAHFGSMVGTGGANVVATINNPRIFCPTYKIMNPDVMASYRSMVAQQGVSIGGVTAKTYINSMPNSANKHVFQINDRSISLLGMVTALRSNNADTDRLCYSNTATNILFTGGHVNQYQYFLSGNSYPAQPIDLTTASNGKSLGRAYDEAVKTLSKPGHTYSHACPGILQFGSNKEVYTSGTSTASIDAGKGLLCVDLKKFDDESLRFKGINTARSSAPGTLEINMSAAPGEIKDVTTYALVEAIWVMSPQGNLTVIQ